MDKRRITLISLFTVVGLLFMMFMVWIFLPGKDIEEPITEVVEQVPEVVEFMPTEPEVQEDKPETQEEIVEEVIAEVIDEGPFEPDIRMFLFLGIDRTEERDETIGIYRSDSIAVLRVDMANKWAKVLSIPRDTYAFLPIRDKKDKINHAYAFGSLKGRAEASVLEAVNLLIGEEEMRHYFTFEMDPIPEVVDDMGGIFLDVELDMQSHGADLTAGPQLLDGVDAYYYVRWRYASDGDIGRIRRQQQFAEAFIKKLSDAYEPADITGMILNNGDHINTNILVSEIEEVIKVLSASEDIEFFTVPGSNMKIDGIYYWKIDDVAFGDVVTSFYEIPVEYKMTE